MCGFVGTISRGELTDAEVEATHRLTDLLARRGPDGRGTWSEGRVGLGHRRLAVRDLGKLRNPPPRVRVVLKSAERLFHAPAWPPRRRGHVAMNEGQALEQLGARRRGEAHPH